MRPTTVVPVCAALFALMLGLSGPAGADVGAPASKEPYVMFTIGDSFGSGEGAPDAPGAFSSGGDLIGGFGAREDWDVRFALNTIDGVDAERCHRSQNSPSGVASRLLQEDFPDIFVDWTSVACSGASIISAGVYEPSLLVDAVEKDPGPHHGGILRDYEGQDSLEGFSPRPARPVYKPQLDQIDDRLGPRPAARDRLDALVVSAGLNDIGFGSFIAACLDIPTFSLPVLGCQDEKEIRQFARTRLRGMPDRFSRMDKALRHDSDVGKDAELDENHAPAAVLLTVPPKVTFKTNSTFCDRESPDDLINNIEKNEAAFMENDVNRKLRNHMVDAAGRHGWVAVTSYVNEFIGHAICQEGRFINQNRDALVSQGEIEEELTGWIPIAGISAGIAHPNRLGYEHAGGGLYAELSKKLVKRFTPTKAPTTTSDNRSDGFLLKVADNDRRATTSGNYFASAVYRVSDSGRPVNRPGLDFIPHGANGTRDYPLGSGRFQVYTSACAPVARDASVGCGPLGVLRLSTIVPKTPKDIGGGGLKQEGGLKLSTFQVRWKHADFMAEHDTTHSFVSVRGVKTRVEGKRTSLMFINGRAAVGSLTRPEKLPALELPKGETVPVQVQACNDEVGCSEPSAPVQLENKTSPKTGPDFKRPDLIDPNRIDVLGPKPCDRTPIPFAQAPGRQLPARNGTGGPINIGSESPNIIPSCPGDPLVANFSLSPRTQTVKPGSEVTLEVKANHPRGASELADVQVQLEGKGGPLTTVTLDERSGKLTAAKGAGAKGPSAKLGAIGAPIAGIAASKLKAGDVTVLTDKGTFKRPKAKSRELRLKLRLRIDKDLAAQTLEVDVAGAGDDGAQQSFAPVGLIKVAK